MLTDIKVENFRGIRSLTLDNLGRITLIGGKNGVGKTALLEALWMLGGPDLPGELTGLMSEIRGIPSSGPDFAFQDLFFDYDTDNRISISVHGDWSEDTARALEIFLHERRQTDIVRRNDPSHSTPATGEHITGPRFESTTEIVFKYKHNDGLEYNSRARWFQELSTQADGVGTALSRLGITQEQEPVQSRMKALFISTLHRENLQSLASAFSNLQILGDVERILPLVRLLEPRLTDLTLITVNNVPVIHARLEGMKRLIPVQLLGEGLNRVLGFALLTSEAYGGILLIDEIENGLHYKIQEEVFSFLMSLAEAFDVQIFATTHSRECIIAAHKALNKGQRQEFAFYRLDRLGKEVKAVHFDDGMLDTSVEYGMEMR